MADTAGQAQPVASMEVTIEVDKSSTERVGSAAAPSPSGPNDQHKRQNQQDTAAVLDFTSVIPLCLATTEFNGQKVPKATTESLVFHTPYDPTSLLVYV